MLAQLTRKNNKKLKKGKRPDGKYPCDVRNQMSIEPGQGSAKARRGKTIPERVRNVRNLLGEVEVTGYAFA